MAYLATAVANERINAVGLPMTVTSNYTIMNWFFIETTSEHGQSFNIGGDQNDVPHNNGYGLAVGLNTGAINGNEVLAAINGVAWLDTNTSFGTGWHHQCLVDRNGQQFIYLDGQVIGGFTSPAITPTDYTTIGDININVSGNELTAGNAVALIKVWNIALGTTQIQAEMNSSYPLFYKGLVLFWPIETSGATGTAYVKDPTQSFTIAGAPNNVDSGVNFTDNPPVAR